MPREPPAKSFVGAPTLQQLYALAVQNHPPCDKSSSLQIHSTDSLSPAPRATSGSNAQRSLCRSSRSLRRAKVSRRLITLLLAKSFRLQILVFCFVKVKLEVRFNAPTLKLFDSGAHHVVFQVSGAASSAKSAMVENSVSNSARSVSRFLRTCSSSAITITSSKN